MKNIIELRKKKMKDGGYSLYLDMYRDGTRSYEFLRMYLLPGNSPNIRKQNSITLEAAKTIQAQRIVEIQRGEARMLERRTTLSMGEFFCIYMDEKIFSRSRAYVTKAAWKIWCEVVSPSRSLMSVKPEDVRRYIRHLAGIGIKEGSQVEYTKVMSTVCNTAVRKGYIKANPFSRLERTEKPSVHKGASIKYLTADEVIRMIDAPCSEPVVKQAFLFSCFTGLRYSDLKQLTWDMVHGNQLELNQKKTEEAVYIPLSANAKRWLPEKNSGTDKVYPALTSLCINNQYAALKEWGDKAGIRKHITFHVGRHTCATLLLSYGADIYTISKILGHSNVGVTQVYAQVLSKDKERAVNLVPDL